MIEIKAGPELEQAVDKIVGIKPGAFPHCPLATPGPCRIHELLKWLTSWVEAAPKHREFKINFGESPATWWIFFHSSTCSDGFNWHATKRHPKLREAISEAILFIHDRKKEV